MGLHKVTARNDRGLNSLKSLYCYDSYWSISAPLSCSAWPEFLMWDTSCIHEMREKK